MLKEFVVPEEVALEEVKNFAEYHLDKPLTAERINEEFPAVVSAVMRGLIDLNDPEKPVYKLREPIKNDSGNIEYEKIEFKTRMKASDYQNLSKGIDMAKDAAKFSNVIQAHLSGLPSVVLLDKLPNKHDYRLIQQITGLFT